MIYLDNAATSWPKAPGVAEAISKVITEPLGNVGRSAHQPAITASRLVFDFRMRLHDVIPATTAEKTICTRNATEALNMAILGMVGDGSAKSVLTTCVEHNAVARPLHQLETRGVHLEFTRCDAYGRVDVEVFRKQLREKHFDLAVFTAANNVSGACNDVSQMVQSCIESDVPFVIDASQVAGEVLLEAFPESARGALCFSAHKGLLGPTGIGVMALYGDFAPRPLWYGGTGSRSDSEVQPDFLPDRYESGTPAVHAIAGAKAAVEYISGHVTELAERRKMCADMLFGELSSMDRLRMLSSESNRVGVISVTVKEGTIGDLTRALYAKDVAVRSGFHCAPWTHRHFGTVEHGGAIRFSPGFATTIDEVHETIAIVREAVYGR